MPGVIFARTVRSQAGQAMMNKPQAAEQKNPKNTMNTGAKVLHTTLLFESAIEGRTCEGS